MLTSPFILLEKVERGAEEETPEEENLKDV